MIKILLIVFLSERVNKFKSKEKESRSGVYKHLMTGVSFMIPFVVAGGLLIALGFAIGGIYVFKLPLNAPVHPLYNL
jgi:fructose PTS system EIIBC or EIIC component